MASNDQRQQLYSLFSQLGDLNDIPSDYSSLGYTNYIQSLVGGINDYDQFSSSPYNTKPVVPQSKPGVPQSLVDMFGSKVLFSPIYGMTAPTGDSDPVTDYNNITGYRALVGDVGAIYDAQGKLQKTYRKEGDSSLMKLMRVAMPALAGGVLGGAAFAPQLLGGTAAATSAAPISASTPSWISGVGSTAGMSASEIAAATSSLGSGMGIGATGSAAITPLGAAPSAVATPLGGATGAGSAASAGGFLQQLLGGGSAVGGLLNKLGDSSNLAALYNAYTQRQQGGDMQDWAERLYGDRKQFLDRLAQSYEDPSSYLEGPEYQRMADIELDRLMRKDAARGRLGTDVERQKLMQDYALSHLKDYRSGLAGAAGLTGTQGVAELDIAGGANERGFLNALFSQAARGAQQPAQQTQNFNVIDFLSNILDLGDLFA